MQDNTQVDERVGAQDAEGQAIPLTGIAVEARLAGPFLSVVMKQRWSNSGSKPIEALWHFPVPEGATVRGLEIEREGHRFVAELDERDAAFDRFDRALEEGKRAALLDAETEGILALRLGNLAPRDSVLVELSYVAVVEEAGGSLRVRIPTAIAPRYFPANYKDDRDVPLADSLDLPWVPKVPYGISVAVELADPAAVAEYSSPSHKLVADKRDGALRVGVGGGFEAMDRDFVLDLRLANDRPARAWFEADDRGTWLAADLRFPEAKGRGAQSVAFLLDISGSMAGESLAAAQRAIKAALGALGGDDRFGLFAFNNTTVAMAPSPLPASEAEVLKARSWIDGLEADGGTELHSALEAVYAAGAWTEVIVLTDGDVGDVDAISGLAAGRLGAMGARLSLLGIGSSPSGDALAAIARAGGGSMATVHPGDRIEPRALALARGMLAGRLEGIRLVSEGQDCELAATVLANHGQRCRFLGKLPAAARLGEGMKVVAASSGKEVQVGLSLMATGGVVGKPGALAALWARDRVADILDRSGRAEGRDRKRLEKAAVALSREAGILSTVVSMVIVDAEGPRVAGRASQVEVPVLLPAGYGGGAYDDKESLAMSLPASPAPMMAQKVMDLAFEVQSSTAHREYKKRASMARRSASGPHAMAFAEDSAGSGLYDLLALQLPGGGFGPAKEVLAILGLAKAQAFPLAGAEAERCALAALALAWLSERHGSEAEAWEGLVEKSRKLVADFAAGQPGDSPLADPMGWAKARLAGAKA